MEKKIFAKSRVESQVLEAQGYSKDTTRGTIAGPESIIWLSW